VSVTDDDLVARAEAARQRAYAPYSRYRVGAAVLAGGAVFVGANVENASFSATLCAERVAIANAVQGGGGAVEAVAVVTQSSPPAAPCGVCLQTLQELAADPATLRVIMANPAGERSTATLAELLPRGFGRSALDEPT
jgi:cytidine deaminase